MINVPKVNIKYDAETNATLDRLQGYLADYDKLFKQMNKSLTDIALRRALLEDKQRQLILTSIVNVTQHATIVSVDYD